MARGITWAVVLGVLALAFLGGALAWSAMTGRALGTGSTTPGEPPVGVSIAPAPSSDGRGDPGGTAGSERDDEVDPFDDDHPAIAGLDADVRAALQAAARDAVADGVRLWVTSGARSAEYQQELLDRAIQTYGSLDEARKRVATPETSSHVTGQAVDIGPTEAADWFVQHGDAYGLCQTYANEMWHFELATTPGGECPAMLPDARS